MVSNGCVSGCLHVTLLLKKDGNKNIRKLEETAVSLIDFYIFVIIGGKMAHIFPSFLHARHDFDSEGGGVNHVKRMTPTLEKTGLLILT